MKQHPHDDDNDVSQTAHRYEWVCLPCYPGYVIIKTCHPQSHRSGPTLGASWQNMCISLAGIRTCMRPFLYFIRRSRAVCLDLLPNRGRISLCRSSGSNCCHRPRLMVCVIDPRVQIDKPSRLCSIKSQCQHHKRPFVIPWISKTMAKYQFISDFITTVYYILLRTHNPTFI
jgi:hypothetical protein